MAITYRPDYLFSLFHSHNLFDASNISTRSTLINQEGVDTAFSLIDLGLVSKAVDQWRLTMPRVEPVYSIASNPDDGIIGKDVFFFTFQFPRCLVPAHRYD
jgi:hypothetical protein